MILTDIKQQKNDPERYSIFVDGEFCAGLSAETVVAFGLKRGMEISEDDISRINGREAYTSALARALDHAARASAKSARDYRIKLSGDYPEETVDAVIARLEELGYINDLALARDIVARCLEKGEGELMMRQKLAIKGIDNVTALEACDVDYDLFIEAAKKSCEKAVARYGTADVKSRAKVYAALQRKGFTSDIINEVISFNEDM